MPSRPSMPSRPVRLALWASVPIAVLGIVVSAAGLLWDSTYEQESANWAAQGAGQDAVNLAIFPVMLVLAWWAARGSLRAYLGWLGLVAYTAYSYLLYAGYVHFAWTFLPYVAVFGLATWALIAGIGLLDPLRVRAAFAPSAPARGVGWVLGVLGSMFALLWLSEIVPPLLEGTTPETLTEAGLVSNPVWILDLAIVLPAMIATGVLLHRRRPLGFTLAAPLLGFGVTMGVAILGMMAMQTARDEPVAAVAVVMMGITIVVESVALWRLLAALPSEVTIGQAVRAGAAPDAAPTGGRAVLQRTSST